MFSPSAPAPLYDPSKPPSMSLSFSDTDISGNNYITDFEVIYGGNNKQKFWSWKVGSHYELKTGIYLFMHR